MSPSNANVQSAVAATARVLLGTLFVASGVGKIFAPAVTQGYIASAGLPFPELVYALTVVIEVGAGALLMVGYWSRLMAVILSVFTVAAALLFHRAVGDPDQLVHFMKNLAIAGGLLHVAAFGAGAFSLDGYAPESRRSAAT